MYVYVFVVNEKVTKESGVRVGMHRCIVQHDPSRVQEPQRFDGQDTTVQYYLQSRALLTI